MGNGLSTVQAEHLDAVVGGLGRAGLLALVTLLRDAATWPLQQPDLARGLLSRARELRVDIVGRIRGEISNAMNVRRWSYVDGASEDLEQVRSMAAACAHAEADPDLKADFEQTLARVEALAEELRREHEDDDE